MQRREQYLQGLLELHKLRDPGARRAAWRGSLATVARACTDDLPSPLDGLSPQAVLESVRVALQTGLIDDLDWLSASSAGAAIYEVAAALPSGNEKRDLGRRVLSRLLDGDADSFVALATRMARSGGRGLSGEAVRARVALSVGLPSSTGVRVDSMALALLSRRELLREWVAEPAAGCLPDRRLAGRILEQAARAMLRRLAQGDERPLQLLRTEALLKAWERLLEDREPLVWRHVAIARGLLSANVPAFSAAIESGLAPHLSPTEWRRSAASLTASAAQRPDEALHQLRDVLGKGFLRRDPGAVSALLWGLPAAAEIEPDLAEEMLEMIIEASPTFVAAETMGELLWLGPGASFGKRAVTALATALSDAAAPSGHDADDGALALRMQIVHELSPESDREPTLIEGLRRAQVLFAEQGARAAYQAAQAAHEQMVGHLSTLEALDLDRAESRALSIARRTAFSALRQLDMGLLEDDLARDLLQLGGKSPDTARLLADIDDAHERVERWVQVREQEPLSPTAPVPHPTIRFHRIRTLLHLADARVPGEGEEAPTLQASRARCTRIAATMLRHLVSGPPQALHRAICATLARAADALIRAGACDPVDVLLVAATRGLGANDMATLSEASMHGDLRGLLAAYRTMLHALAHADEAPPSVEPPTVEAMLAMATVSAKTSLAPLPSGLHAPAGRQVLALDAFSRAAGLDESRRGETLRSSLHALAKALSRILASRSLTEISYSGQGASPIAELEAALESLGQLAHGAKSRLGDRNAGVPYAGLSLGLGAGVDASITGADPEALPFAIAQAREELAIFLPHAVADVVCSVLDTIASLPAVASMRPVAPEAPVEAPLPAWLPRRRTLGGFYVVRALGSGTGGTVFMARRIEDKNDEAAERFALKVPDYDGIAARALSEDEFLQLFREEASALLGLPRHRNLAGFVTFDLASRPKPILVMELVEGVNLERTISAGNLEVRRAIDLLEGVLAGLSAMHEAGVGHLDLKPSNVILRDGNEAVLVDFGLSGRHIRPGCATLPYGAPEIWGVVPEGVEPLPWQADMYAFACLAFEVLTGQELFVGDSETALIASHVAHDGWPERLVRFSDVPDHDALAQVLARALRRDPRERASASQIRALLEGLRPQLAGLSWPMQMPRSA